MTRTTPEEVRGILTEIEKLQGFGTRRHNPRNLKFFATHTTTKEERGILNKKIKNLRGFGTRRDNPRNVKLSLVFVEMYNTLWKEE